MSEKKYEDGLKDGRLEAKKEIVLKMFKKNFSLQTIIELTGLELEEILKIQEKFLITG